MGIVLRTVLFCGLTRHGPHSMNVVDDDEFGTGGVILVQTMMRKELTCALQSYNATFSGSDAISFVSQMTER